MVMWWCQPRQKRSSSWSMPSSPFPSAKHASIGQRIALAQTKLASGVAGGAQLRDTFRSGSSVEPLTLRRNTTQTSGPGRFWRGATARIAAKSATSGPLLPSRIRYRCQRSAGICAASASTCILAGLAGCSRSRRGTGPLRERVWGGTQRVGRGRTLSPSGATSGQT